MNIKNKKLSVKKESAINALFILILLTSIQNVIALPDKLPFEPVDSIEGFSIVAVNIKSFDNEVWLGTLNGLGVIKPGYKKIFNSANGYTTSDHVSGIAKDENGYVWASIWGGGIFYVSLESMDSGLLQLQNPEAFRSLNCGDIVFHAQLNKLLASCESDLLLIDPGTKAVEVLEVKGQQNPIDFYKLQLIDENQVFVGTYGDGIYQIKLNDREVIRHLMPAAYINDIAIGMSNKLLISTTEGAYVYSSENRTLKKITKTVPGLIWDENTTSILEITSGTYLIAIENHGLFQYNETQDTLDYASLYYPFLKRENLGRVNYIASLSDQNGIILGVESQGALFIPSRHHLVSFFDADALNTNDISLNQQFEDSLYIADNLNLYRADPQSHRLSPFVADSGHTYFIEAAQDDLIISTYKNGIMRVSRDGNVLERHISVPGLAKTPASSYSAIEKITIDDYLLGTDIGEEQGIFRGNFIDGFIKLYDDVTTVAIERHDVNKYFVLSAFTGMIGYNPVNNQFSNHPYPQNDLLFDCMERIGADRYLLCARRNNSFIFDASTNSYTEFRPEGKDLKNVRSAKFIMNKLWLTTSKGLMVYDFETDSLFQIKSSEGFRSSEFDSRDIAIVAGSRLLIPGNFGLALLDTNKTLDFITMKRASETTVELLSYELQASDATEPGKTEVFYAVPDEIVLPGNNLLLKFHLSHSNLLEMDNIGYQFNLSGLHQDWRNLSPGENSITYTSIPPGEYFLNVKAYDARSLNEQPERRVKVVVPPPWWQTLYALVFFAMLFISIVYLTQWFRGRQLKRLNQNLAEKVKERTATIENLLSQKQTFFANVSHEFRTPLSLIIGPLDAISTRLVNNEDRHQLAIIQRNARRLTRLVDQILELAKFETSKSLPKEVYDVLPLVETLARSFQPLLEAKQQHLTVTVESHLKVRLVQDSLEMILTNLLSNAVKYCPDGSEVSICGCLENEMVKLSVCDNGDGISSANQAMLFDRFTRFDAGEGVEGSGLGLALVKQLMINNNGKIEVHSTVKQGTTFTLWFPMNADQTESATGIVKRQIIDAGISELSSRKQTKGDKVLVANSAAGKTLTDHRYKLLIVEDNPDLRDFLSLGLQAYYDIELAIDGAEGLHKAQQNIPDLILSDILMPNMDGYQLTNAIRNDEATSHIPIVLLTAKGDDLSRMKGWQEQVDDYLTKPFNFDELKLRIKCLISVRDILRKKHTSELSNNLAIKNNEAISFQTKRDRDFFVRFEAVIAQHYNDEHFTRAEAASHMALSERQLNRKLSALVDYNFSEYLRKFRLQKSCELLLSGKQVTEVSYDIGFNSPSYFSSCFKAEYEKTPRQFVEEQEASTASQKAAFQ